MVSKKKAAEIIDVMEQLFPDAHCELNFKNEFYKKYGYTKDQGGV